MFRVENTILSDDISTARFSCDLLKCKGACCVIGDAGAPVTEEEVPALETAYELLKDELHPKVQQIVEEQGLIQKSEDGMELSCRDNNKECIFVSYGNNNVAYCAIQKAYKDGRLKWEKPLSCHLYPIRLQKVGHITYANFEYVPKLCRAACEKGEEKGIYLSDFLEKPLTRRFGKKWYQKFQDTCKEIRMKSFEAARL